MHGHMALGVDDILLGIQAAGNVERGQLRRAAAQGGRLLAHGQRMQISHAEQAIIILLQQLKVAQRADIVANGERAGGLNGRIQHGLAGFFRHDTALLSVINSP